MKRNGRRWNRIKSPSESVMILALFRRRFSAAIIPRYMRGNCRTKGFSENSIINFVAAASRTAMTAARNAEADDFALSLHSFLAMSSQVALCDSATGEGVSTIRRHPAIDRWRGCESILAAPFSSPADQHAIHMLCSAYVPLAYRTIFSVKNCENASASISHQQTSEKGHLLLRRGQSFCSLIHLMPHHIPSCRENERRAMTRATLTHSLWPFLFQSDFQSARNILHKGF